MAATVEMRGIALKTRPHAVCLVPERREERTTEGGLDVAAQRQELQPIVAELRSANIAVAVFVAAERHQIDAAAEIGVSAIEIHTGRWCEAVGAGALGPAEAEWLSLASMARHARGLGLEVHAGHGLDFQTAQRIAAVPEIVELNIGYFLIGEAILIGLTAAVERMRGHIDRGRVASR